MQPHLDEEDRSTVRTPPGTSTPVEVPAGWYADPVEVAASGFATQRRWWDGTQWTQHVAPLATPVSPAVSNETLAAVTAASAAAVGSSSRPSSAAIASSAAVGLAPATVTPGDSTRAAQSMPLHALDPTSGKPARQAAVRTFTPPADPPQAEAAHYEPFSMRDRLTAAAHRSHRELRNPRHLLVNTAPVWLIATMPLTQALMVFVAVTALPAASALWATVIAIVVSGVLTTALAAHDTRLMRSAGHARTAPLLTALVAPPVYLGIRGLRVLRATGVPPWPLVTWLATQLTIIGVWLTIDAARAQALLTVLT